MHDRLISSECGATINWAGSVIDNSRTPNRHEGHSGWKVDQILDFADTWLQQAQPDFITLHLGTNDILRAQSALSTEQELNQLLDKVDAYEVSSGKDVTVFMANVVPVYGWWAEHELVWPDYAPADIAGEMQELTGLIGNLVSTRQSQGDLIHLVDVNSLFYINESNIKQCDGSAAGDPNNMGLTNCIWAPTGTAPEPDGIHPTLLGEQFIADQFYNAIVAHTSVCEGAATDNTAPDTTISVPSAEGVELPSSVVFSGTATDNPGGSGIQNIRVAIENLNYTSASDRWFHFATGEFGGYAETSVLPDNNGVSATWEIAVTLPGGGSYRFYALAVDNSGNQNYFNIGVWPVNTAFVVGNTGPALTVDEVNNNSYGFSYAGVNSNPSEAAFNFDHTGGDLTLSLTAYDIDSANENQIFVNGVSVGFLNPTGNNSSGNTTLVIPASALVTGSNTIVFQQLGSGWRWGIADIALSSGANHPVLVAGQLHNGIYGFHHLGVTSNPSSASFNFAGIGTSMHLVLSGFDIDSVNENSVYLNGVLLGNLEPTGDNATGFTSLDIPASAQVVGTNTLRFEQLGPGWIWGIKDILLGTGTLPLLSLTPGIVDSSAYGYNFQGTRANPEEAEFAFNVSNFTNGMQLQVTGFDIDSGNENEVFVNGNSIGNLMPTPDNGTSPTVMSIPASVLSASGNVLLFKQLGSGWNWGVTDVLLTVQ